MGIQIIVHHESVISFLNLIYEPLLEKYDKDTFNEIDLVITSAKELPGREIKDLTAQDFDTLDEIIQSLWYQSRRT